MFFLFTFIFFCDIIKLSKHKRSFAMKKIFAIMICLGLSGCYVPADYYYEDSYVVSDGYAPAYSTTYVSGAPTVVYEQPAVIYYDSPIYPRYHYYHSRPHHYNPPHHHHPAPHHGGGHKPQPAPHHGGGGHHSGGSHHGGGHSAPSHGHHK